MTLAVRNAVVNTGAILSILLLTTFCVMGYQLLTGAAEVSIEPEIQHSWLARSWEVGRTDVYASVVAAGLGGLIATLGLAASTRVFRRVNSAELYFVALFLVALSAEQIRVLQLYLYQFNLPVMYGTLLTRFVVVARVGGALSLFAASLYAVGIDYPRTGTISVVLAVLAFVFVYLVPVDSLSAGATLLHRVGGQSAMELALLAVGLVTIANYVVAGARGHRDRGFLIALSAACLVVAGEILWFVPSLPWLAAAITLLTYGLMSFMLVTRAHLLWD
jgi:hypothetical protein